MSLRPATAAFRITAIVLTIVFIISESAGLKTLAFVHGNAWHNVGLVFAYWIDMLPQGFCLGALWVATNVFHRLGRGEAFNPAVVKGLRGIGLNLVMSAVSAILIVPCLKPLLQGLGESFVLSLAFNANVESVTIGLIGLVLYMVARQGSALKTELESFV
jgi:hypothetical protein